MFKVIGICGAQGALLYKLKKYLVANVEPRSVFHTKQEEQWNLNFEGIPFVKDLSSLNLANDIDLVIGSPSCGHSSRFSYSRKKSLGKPKEDITLNFYINSVLSIQPKVFVMENLPKLIELFPIEEWQKLFENYHISTHSRSVGVFGNSQLTRKRMIMVGVRNDKHSLHKVNFHDIFSCRPNHKTCGELRKHIQHNINYTEALTKKMSMYHYSDKTKSSLTVREIKDLWNGEFSQEFRWPMKGHKMKTLPGVYRNPDNTYPLTLRPSNRQFEENGLPMGLEWYRLIMGFPRAYKIYFDESNPTYWLNKARIAYTKGAVFEIGTWVYRLLKKSGVLTHFDKSSVD